MVRHLRSTGRPSVCAPVVNRDVNQLELGRRPWSSPTLDLGRRSRVEEREVDPESGDYGFCSLIPSYIRDSSVAVIVYDVTGKLTISKTISHQCTLM